MSKRRCDREGVGICHTVPCLDACGLQDAVLRWQIKRQLVPEGADDLSSPPAACLALDDVADLPEIDPAHKRRIGENRLHSGRGWLLAL